MKAATLTFLCLTALASQAHASSPDAWEARVVRQRAIRGAAFMVRGILGRVRAKL